MTERELMFYCAGQIQSALIIAFSILIAWLVLRKIK